VRMTNPEDLDDTMSAEAYASLVEGS